MSVQNLYEETPREATVTLTRNEVEALLQVACGEKQADPQHLYSAYLSLLVAKRTMDPVYQGLKKQAPHLHLS